MLFFLYYWFILDIERIDYMETLGDRIRKIRLAKGYTRKELGLIMNLNCPDNRLDEYEAGKKNPRKPMLNRLAQALNVSEDYLLTGNMDSKTISGMYADGIFTRSEFDDSNKPKYHWQLSQLIMNNEKLIEDCLTQEDYEKIGAIIYERVLAKKGNLNDVLPFMTIDEYNDYCFDQAMREQEEQEEYELHRDEYERQQYEELQEMIRLGQVFCGDDGQYHQMPTCKEEEDEYIEKGIIRKDEKGHIVYGTSPKNKDN